MHRSNTSLVGKAFFQAGLFLGDELMPPSQHNKEGYFEEQKIIKLHDKWLNNRGLAFWDLTRVEPSTQAFLPGEEAEAQALLERIYGDQPIFGFKDPRASLFLPLWKKLLPEARFVLVYRSPLKTARSLVKRRDFKTYSYFLVGQAYRALQVWETYNRYLLNFADQHPDDCVMLHAPVDFLPPNAEHFQRRLLEEWAIPLPAFDFSKAINTQLLRTKEERKYQWLLTLQPRYTALYQTLQQHATNISKA